MDSDSCHIVDCTSYGWKTLNEIRHNLETIGYAKVKLSQLDRKLVFHTDCSYEENAPKFVALYVVQCDRTDDGEKFQMVKTSEIIEKLSHKSQKLLKEETYKIRVSPDFRKGETEYICGPILIADGHMKYRRDIIDKIQLKNETIEKQHAINELNSIILSENKLNIFRSLFENNMMVLSNNAKYLHRRSKIKDLERYFLRIRSNLI
ncbi:unnamed protein product [Didymodactylos carnosus]|uniref:Uncharacterized protein n=1 Tax=Didymodactylos carnosus TaxID=1234261 RepID=A0A815FIS5_9BILA|nr:unnamed protein product [Didymodactylos carnosus]CAF1329285.1 unnamed protein product [Didymodactylos carnosus]CAF3753270.1 unnamed protein product [Didymodactylos carnosus]CAF4181524.1 unnamed protein product [Didymodactylos carnosus]